LVEQAIGNLVANAIVHTPRDSRIIVDSSFNLDEISLLVTDDGPGIAPDALPHIFDKFAKGPQRVSTRADGSQGIGLGLAIAKGIADAHGGSIEVESPASGGRGTRFTMRFPREQASK
jgi:two-component system sensor histidine kinase KdpD